MTDTKQNTMTGGPWIQDGPSGRWWQFGACRELIAVDRISEVAPALREIEARVERDGLWAAGFLSYEAAPAFDPALRTCARAELPLISFGLYAPPSLVDLPVAAPISAPEYQWEASIGRDAYDHAIAAIRRLIAAGDSYQVNYTFRLRAAMQEHAQHLFRRMIAANHSRCGAYVDCGRFVVCSASPELFFRLDGGMLESRPMKGTSGRGLWPAQDSEIAAALRDSPKNRAENVMIVDMMRNDMGVVSVPGTVCVPALFSLEAYPDVWQMTSTVQSRTDAPVSEVLAAMFPPASVTGAPKIRSTQVIADLETSPRGIYTGCIGWIAPGRRAQFNVAIRTAVVDRELGSVEYGVGGGIVWDSTSEDEYRECLLKARVVTAPSQEDYELLETMLWEPQQGYFLLDRHLQRLTASAALLGFVCDCAQIRARLEHLAQKFDAGAQRVRLLLARNGAVSLESKTLQMDQSVVRLRLAPKPVDECDPFLYNKSTQRRVYEQALHESGECDDVLLWNGRGEVTETSIANVVAEIGGIRLTPPVSSGLLPGVFRGHLLASGEIVEQVLRVPDLKRATRLWTINSVRRWRDAILLE